MTNEMTTVANPLVRAQNGGSQDNQIASAGAQAEAARASEETMVAMQFAMMRPRDEIKAMDKILNACASPSLAEVAVYSYARGGTDIKGPSIRVAEAIAQCWGNITYGVRELSQKAGASEVETFAWDLETNVRISRRFMVPHTRHTRQGAVLLTDPRDIYELVANNGSRRLRACILQVIRRDVVDAAVDQCELTLNQHADTSPDHQAKILAAFERFGITRAQVEARIQRRMDAVTAAQVVNLEKIYISIRDGLSKPEDWFEAEETKPEGPAPANRTEGVKGKLAQRSQAAPTEAPAPVEKPKAEAETPKAQPEAASEMSEPTDQERATASYTETIKAMRPELKTKLQNRILRELKTQTTRPVDLNVPQMLKAVEWAIEIINEDAKSAATEPVESEVVSYHQSADQEFGRDEDKPKAEKDDPFGDELPDSPMIRDAEMQAVAQPATEATNCAGCDKPLSNFERDWSKKKGVNPPLCKDCRPKAGEESK